MDFLFKLRTTVADKKTQKLNGYPYLVIRRNPCATGKQPRRLDSTRKLISSTKVDFFRLVIYPTNRKIFCALFYGKIFFSMSRIRAFQPSFYPFLHFLLSAHRRRLHRLSLSFFFLLNFPPLPPHEMGLLLRTRSVAATSPLLPRSDSAVTQFDLPSLPPHPRGGRKTRTSSSSFTIFFSTSIQLQSGCPLGGGRRGRKEGEWMGESIINTSNKKMKKKTKNFRARIHRLLEWALSIIVAFRK